MNYISISSDDKLWDELSPDLRGKDFRVPYSWRKCCSLSYDDWKRLVQRGLAGKFVYVQKTKKINWKRCT